MSSTDRFVDLGRGLIVEDADGNDLSLTGDELFPPVGDGSVVARGGFATYDVAPYTFADEARTGAMVALVPTDPEVLALDGGEAVDDLHVTLFYLGDAVDIPPELQTAILAEIGSRTANNWAGPIEAQVFGASIWNPTSDDPSLVLSVGGPDLQPIRDDARQGIINAPHNVDGDVEAAQAWEMPEQHRPWVPHLCLEYADPELLVEHMPIALERVGPVTFDRVRVAFAGEIRDFKLGGD